MEEEVQSATKPYKSCKTRVVPLEAMGTGFHFSGFLK